MSLAFNSTMTLAGTNELDIRDAQPKQGLTPMSHGDIHYRDPVLLHRFLDNQLTEDEELRVTQHIDECEACRQHLEGILGSGSGWHELQSNLSDFDHQETQASPAGDPAESPQPTVDYRSLLGPTDDPAMLGRLGKYEVTGMIGQGSTGVVFKAYDPHLSRYVAIKVLSAAYANNGLARKRFEREGRAIAAVRNRHVIEVYGVEAYRSSPFIVMQYLPGGSLQKRIHERGCLTTIEVCRIGMQIAEGLAGAHHQGIIHRDIKPANILMEEDLDLAVVSDFGLARVADEASMTQTGVLAGTPEYMSPEQARGEVLDVRSDLFSLGGVLYTACTGHSPFRGETLIGVIHNVREVEPRPIRESNPEVAEWLVAFIGKLLSKDRNQRFESAKQASELLAQELAYLQTPTSSPRPKREWLQEEPRTGRKLLIGSLIGLAIAAAIALTLSSPWQDPSTDKYGIVPTRQEASFYEAKAAYDLAYETHLREVEYRGDMLDAIAGHTEAFALGYNRSESAFNLARAHALQGSGDLAISWLETAMRAGFHNPIKLEAERDLESIRSDPRFQSILEQARELAKKYEEADRTYFGDVNYPRAEQLYRQWLNLCPNDDHAVLMLGASLLEQGKFDEAEVWNERTRHTIRFAGFANYNLGCIAAQRGDTDTAFNYLNYAAETGFHDAAHLEDDHLTRVLRADPRFQALVDHYRAKSEPD